jgi:hypothetical protein
MEDIDVAKISPEVGLFVFAARVWDFVPKLECGNSLLQAASDTPEAPTVPAMDTRLPQPIVLDKTLSIDVWLWQR